MYLDFSNKQNEENAINYVKFQEMQRQLNDVLIRNKFLEDNIHNLNEEAYKKFNLILKKLFILTIIYSKSCL